MKFKICKNQVIGTLCYDYCNMVDHIHERGWLPKYVEQAIFFIAKEYRLTCSYYYDFVNNSFFIKLIGSITNMLRFRNELKYLFGFKEKSDWF